MTKPFAAALSGLAILMMTSTDAHAQSCGDVLLADTVLTAPLTCAGPGLIIGADDIELDCDGFALNGPGSDTGILLDGRTGVTVRNCMVNRFAVGILLTDSPANYLTKNGVSASVSVGNGAFQLSAGSDGNVLKMNRAFDNAGRGFAVIDSVGNLLLDNGAMANGFRGFDLIDAAGNTLIHNFASLNSSGGVVLSGTSDGNILHNNQVTDSSSEGFALLSSVNYLSFNRSDDNGAWGIDDATGAGNLYLFNQCAGNGSGPSNPGGLCL